MKIQRKRSENVKQVYKNKYHERWLLSLKYSNILMDNIDSKKFIFNLFINTL